MNEADIIILGAGPAGMAAARTAAGAGASVAILDENPSPGGQIYRSIRVVPKGRANLLGEAYTEGRKLADAINHPNIKHIAQANIWRVENDGAIAFSVDQIAHQLRGRHIVIATGALERPTPLPGWTLPGVMTAGAAQILLKSSGVVPENAVLAGCGPLLYLIAVQLIKAGCPPKALVETQSFSDYIAALKFLPKALTNWRDIAKGLAMLREIKAAGVQRFSGARDFAIDGDEYASAVRFSSGGRAQTIECETVLLHAGVVPNTQISRALRLEHQWDAHQHCFHPVVDDFGVTSNPQFSIAGDGVGIAGAKAATFRGQLAALRALMTLGFGQSGDLQKTMAGVRSELASALAIRPFLDRLYQPGSQFQNPADDTIICRCEEVTAANIRICAKLGCTGPNQTKTYTRAGMGPCQGRYCGLTVTQILASENNMAPQDVGSYRIRAPLKPVTLGEIASCASVEKPI